MKQNMPHITNKKKIWKYTVYGSFYLQDVYHHEQEADLDSIDISSRKYKYKQSLVILFM